LQVCRILVVVVCTAFAGGCGITVFGSSDDGPKTASFAAEGTRLIMTGVIDDDTIDKLDDAVDDHPDATTIVMRNVAGSENPDVNLALARDLRRRGLSTYVAAGDRVGPGATDVLIGGLHRIAERGASVGVKSWGDKDKAAADLPLSDEAHNRHLEFYREMGIHEEFYWFSLRAARPDGVEWMSEVDMFRFRVVKEMR
jgi:hypothetical protein